MGFECCRQVREGTGDAEAGLFERSMEAVRRDAERCSWLNSMVMFHSLAGGTGSGFGSGLLQASVVLCCSDPSGELPTDDPSIQLDLFETCGTWAAGPS